MPSPLTSLGIVALCAALLSGCSAEIVETSGSWAENVTAAPSPTSTPSTAAAPVVPAPAAAAPAPGSAPASIDYVTPVQRRWGGCFSRLGVGDLYYDSVLGTVTAAWKNGALSWTVGPDNTSGTPADQASVDALAGC